MNIAFVLHGYPPFHNAGAETYAHSLNLWLQSRGHEVLALTRDSAVDWQGITVRKRGAVRSVDNILRHADIILTHLDETPVAEAAAHRLKKPIAHILHNDRQLQFHKVKKADLLVANSHWIAARIPDRLKSSRTEVLYPPTFLTGLDLEDQGRDSITLVNMLEAKGAGLFYDLAERLPDRQFLAVTGAYGQQMKPPALPNITVRPNRVDMEPVWARTRLYLQPSSYESYGKAAVEAMAHRIPVLAHPTAGLLESLDKAGIFIDRDQPDAWVSAIWDLDNPNHYRRVAGMAYKRAQQLEALTLVQLQKLEEALEEAAGR